MTDPFARLRRFLRELKRRKVYRVAVTYAVVAAGAVQLVSVVIPASRLPAWADEFFLALAVFGFPIAVVLAWAFEVTPEGVRRTEAVEGAESEVGAYQWIGLAVVVLLAGGVWYATAGGGGEPAAESAATTDTSATRPASTARDTAGPPRIAVLPFENIARDTGDAFFAQGMHEEVLNQLSKVSGLEVISRTSVMGYADTDKRVPEISRELGGVDALMEGTVRRAGDQVRITTQLIEAPEDEHLWSNTYERALSVEQIFDIQADIAGQIAGALETELTEGERRRIEEAPTDDLAAYDAFVKGRNQYRRFLVTSRPIQLDRAIDHLQDGSRRDSSFAEARAWLAAAYGLRHRFSGEGRWLDSASQTLDRVRAIDSELAALHWAQGFIYQQQDSLELAEEAVRRALDLKPNSAGACSILSLVLHRQGRYAEAVRWAYRAYRLEPRWPFRLWELGYHLRIAGMLEAAERWFRRGVEMDPDAFWPLRGLAATLVVTTPERAQKLAESFLHDHRGHAEALALAGEMALMADHPDVAKSYLEQVPVARREFFPEDSPSRPDQISLNTEERMWLGMTELRLGNRGRGRALLGQAADSLEMILERRQGRGDRAWTHARLGASVAAIGRHRKALQHFGRSAELGFPRTEWLERPQVFNGVRSDPRFQKALRHVERNQERVQEKIRRMDLDLYPPGAEPDTATEKTKTGD